jgi:hypothetical protein
MLRAAIWTRYASANDRGGPFGVDRREYVMAGVFAPDNDSGHGDLLKVFLALWLVTTTQQNHVSVGSRFMTMQIRVTTGTNAAWGRDCP